MTLIAEDGTGRADAQTYGTVAEADAYHALRGNTAWTSISTEAEKERLLVLAMDWLRQNCRGRWKSYRINDYMALDWPRYQVEDVDGYLISHNIVPEDIKNAQFELALRAKTSTLSPDLSTSGGSLTYERKKADEVEIERHWNGGGKREVPAYVSVSDLLRPYLKAGNELIRG